jgi:hypothetical protein
MKKKKIQLGNISRIFKRIAIPIGRRNMEIYFQNSLKHRNISFNRLPRHQPRIETIFLKQRH